MIRRCASRRCQQVIVKGLCCDRICHAHRKADRQAETRRAEKLIRLPWRFRQDREKEDRA